MAVAYADEMMLDFDPPSLYNGLKFKSSTQVEHDLEALAVILQETQERFRELYAERLERAKQEELGNDELVLIEQQGRDMASGLNAINHIMTEIANQYKLMTVNLDSQMKLPHHKRQGPPPLQMPETRPDLFLESEPSQEEMMKYLIEQKMQQVLNQQQIQMQRYTMANPAWQQWSTSPSVPPSPPLPPGYPQWNISQGQYTATGRPSTAPGVGPLIKQHYGQPFVQGLSSTATKLQQSVEQARHVVSERATRNKHMLIADLQVRGVISQQTAQAWLQQSPEQVEKLAALALGMPPLPKP